MVAIAVAALDAQARRIFVGFAALAAKQVRQLCHDNASNPVRYDDAYERHKCSIKILYTIQDWNARGERLRLSSILNCIMVNG